MDWDTCLPGGVSLYSIVLWTVMQQWASAASSIQQLHVFKRPQHPRALSWALGGGCSAFFFFFFLSWNLSWFSLPLPKDCNMCHTVSNSADVVVWTVGLCGVHKLLHAVSWESMWNIFRLAKLKSWFVKRCNVFELLLKTSGKYLMQHAWNLFLSSSVSLALEKKFIVVDCDFRKMQLHMPLVGFTKRNFVCTGKSPEPAPSPFPRFQLTVSCSKLQKRFYFGKCLRQGNF